MWRWGWPWCTRSPRSPSRRRRARTGAAGRPPWWWAACTGHCRPRWGPRLRVASFPAAPPANLPRWTLFLWDSRTVKNSSAALWALGTVSLRVQDSWILSVVTLPRGRNRFLEAEDTLSDGAFGHAVGRRSDVARTDGRYSDAPGQVPPENTGWSTCCTAALSRTDWAPRAARAPASYRSATTPAHVRSSAPSAGRSPSPAAHAGCLAATLINCCRLALTLCAPRFH